MTSTLFLAFLILTAGVVVSMLARYRSAQSAVRFGLMLVLWFVYVGFIARSGAIGNTALRPPAILLVVVPAFAFVALFAVRSSAGGRLAVALPLWLVIALQSFRVGVELFLHQLSLAGLVPRMLTFEGANVDLFVGLSAPAIAWLATKGRTGSRSALIWNVLGVLSLVNVATRALLSAPGPWQLIHTDVANVAFGIFPYSYIPGFFAPLGIALHALAIRAIRTELRTSQPSPRNERVAALS